MPLPTTDRVYKILSADEAATLAEFGRFSGSDADEEDGFIHLCFGHQLAETKSKHFADAEVLVATVDASGLGGDEASPLRYEVSRGGAYFPHLYGALLASVVESTEPFHDVQPAPDVIRFYGPRDAFGELSNFWRAGVFLDEHHWPSTEHYFQAMKFDDEAHRERIRRAPAPKLAKKLGQSREVTMRPTWDDEKNEVMKKALLAKFTQHDALRHVLLGTGAAQLVEHTQNDAVWGDGGDGKGENRLGKLLEEVRETLRG